MDHTQPPSGAAPSRETNGTGGANDANAFDRFFVWLRSLGIVRGNDRWFAGVAGGVAARAGIDPLIVRGIFVVLALLGGPGIVLYLVGWLLLPDSTGRIHFEELIRGRAQAGVIITTVILGLFVALPLFVRMLSTLFLAPWGWDLWSGPGFGWVGATLTVIWWALVVPALIIWLIVWIAKGGFGGRGKGGESTARSFADQAGDAARDFADKTESAARDFGRRAGAQAQDWNQRATAWSANARAEANEWARTGREAHRAYESHRLGAAHTVISLALALLAAGVAASWALARGADTDFVLTAGLIAAVGVLAVSVIIAGVRGRQTGWIGFLSFVGVLALIFAPFSSLLPDQTRFVPFGNAAVTATADDADSAIVMIAGNTTVDLRRLTPLSAPRDIDVWLIGGNATVELPPAHTMQVQVDVLAGAIAEDRAARAGGGATGDLEQSGVFLSRTIGSEPTADSGPQVTRVKVHVAFGKVRVLGADGSAASASALESEVVR